MATIGVFKKTGRIFEGELNTLNVQAKGVRIVPEDNKASDKSPDYRVFVGRVEIGVAWDEESTKTGRKYISVKCDDPSFTQPIFASLFDDEGADTYSLIWTRNRASND